MRFVRKKAVVTGASRGLGSAIAQLLLEEGAQVALVARQTDPPSAYAGALREGRAVWIARDIKEPSAPDDIVHTAISQFGELHLLVNAAGGARIVTALDATEEAWREDFELKFFGYLRMMRAVIPSLRRHEGGVMLNLVGIAGKDPNPNLATASALNAALRALTKVMADELAPYAIRVVNIDPGACETGLLDTMGDSLAALKGGSKEDHLRALRARAPLGRLPQPLDVARLALFLLSDEANLISGTSVDIDGGAHRGLA